MWIVIGKSKTYINLKQQIKEAWIKLMHLFKVNCHAVIQWLIQIKEFEEKLTQSQS